MNFTDLSYEVTYGKMNENFKAVVICYLSQQKNFIAKKIDIAIRLSQMNRGKKHPYFMEHNTVFDVLSNRLGIIKRVGDSYKLDQSLNDDQKAEIMRLCKKRMEADF